MQPMGLEEGEWQDQESSKEEFGHTKTFYYGLNNCVLNIYNIILQSKYGNIFNLRLLYLEMKSFNL